MFCCGNKWRVKTTKRNSWCHFCRTRDLCASSRESEPRRSERRHGGCRRHRGVLHIKAASPPLGVISERWIFIGRKEVAFALYGYEQNKMIFFFFSRYDSLFTVWVETLVGNACVFDIKEKAKTKSLSWWLKVKQPSKQSHGYHKKMKYILVRKYHLVIQLIRRAQ